MQTCIFDKFLSITFLYVFSYCIFLKLLSNIILKASSRSFHQLSFLKVSKHIFNFLKTSFNVLMSMTIDKMRNFD
jgi:hypothetical protein